MEAFIGQIVLFAGNFAPRGWALCDGKMLRVNQNTSLFTILNNTYGGDGRETFALPDLRGRAPLHAGNAPGLPSTKLGEKQDVAQSTGDTIQFGTLGLNYIICLQGIFPARN